MVFSALNQYFLRNSLIVKCDNRNAANIISESTSSDSMKSPLEYSRGSNDEEEKKGSMLRDMLSGIAGGMAGKIVEYPLDTVKVRLQTMGDQYKGPIDVIKKAIKNDGFLSLYKGMASPFLGAMAENCVLFLGYGIVTRNLKKQSGIPDNESPLWWHTVIGGITAGLFVSHVLTPVELIKCRLQIQDAKASLNKNIIKIESNLTNVIVKEYKGPIDLIVRVVKSEGISGLFRGHSATLLREIPGNVAWFGGYELACLAQVKLLGLHSKRELGPLSLMSAGAVGGICYWVLPYPADTIKSRLQTDVGSGKASSVFTVFQDIVKNQGLRGLYRGVGIAAIRAVPANATIFTVYEMTQRALSPYC